MKVYKGSLAEHVKSAVVTIAGNRGQPNVYIAKLFGLHPFLIAVLFGLGYAELQNMLESTMKPGTVEIALDHPNSSTWLSTIDTVDG